MNSRAKGKRGERACAAMLRSAGLDAFNQPQSDGKVNAEVVVRGMEHIHIECKWNEQLDLGTKLWTDACAQAEGDAKATGARTWIVIFKRNRKPWNATWYCPRVGCLTTATGPTSIAGVLSKLADTADMT